MIFSTFEALPVLGAMLFRTGLTGLSSRGPLIISDTAEDLGDGIPEDLWIIRFEVKKNLETVDFYVPNFVPQIRPFHVSLFFFFRCHRLFLLLRLFVVLFLGLSASARAVGKAAQRVASGRHPAGRSFDQAQLER